MSRQITAVVGCCLALVFLNAWSAEAQCAGGAGAQTGLASVSCAGAPAWTGQAVASGATVTYNNCLYKANQAVSANTAWCPGCAGIYLYGNGSACPAAGCSYGAQGPCSGGATPTATVAARATATTAPRATATTAPRATATPRTTPRATATSTTAPRATATPTTAPRATPTPCTSCGGALPAKVITGYWQNFNNSSRCLRLSDVPSKYNLIAVAFADAYPAGGAGAVNFTLDPSAGGLTTCVTGGYSDTAFRADINTVKARGQHVILSVGGANGTITVSDSTSANNFANSVVSLMTSYGFEGVDIDLENGISAVPMTQALKSIRSQKPGAIVTTAPQTVDMLNSTSGYFQVALNTPIDIANLQFYNSGCMLGCGNQVTCWGQGTEDFLTVLACQELQQGLSPSQVGLGVPASTSAAGGGYVSPTVVNNAMNCLKSGASCGTFKPPQTWPAGVRGAMTWSVNWDAVQSYGWVNGITVP